MASYGELRMKRRRITVPSLVTRMLLQNTGRSKEIQKNGTELMMNINSGLAKKIKLPPPNTSLTIKKESNALLAEHKGNSQKLLSTIKNNLSKQCVLFNGNSKVPAWMLSNSSKQNRALASSFYACAMEMSREQNK